MALSALIKRARQFAKPFRITDGKGFRLKTATKGATDVLCREPSNK